MPLSGWGVGSRRRRRRDPGDPVGGGRVADDPTTRAERFWRSWDALAPEIAVALGEGEPHRVENTLCDLVAAVHPDLHFALDRGVRSVYAFVVSGQEDPALRPYTDAWKTLAPPDTALWEFHDSVPAVPDPTEVTVNLGAHRIALADVLVRAEVDPADGVVDVAVFHPAFAELAAEARTALTFLPLDATLGERLAGERLRRVETALVAPADGIGLVELRELIHRLPF